MQPTTHYQIDLRKFEVIAIRATGQDGWKIETRKRVSGKLMGQEYKVFIAPDGTKHYSLTSAANKGGFKRTKSMDGRTARHKKKPGN